MAAVTRYLFILAMAIGLTLAAPIRYAWWLLLALAGSERAWRAAVAEDRAWNVPWGGSDRLCISTRAGLAARQGKRWGCVLCRLLGMIQPDHCEKSIQQEEGNNDVGSRSIAS